MSSRITSYVFLDCTFHGGIVDHSCAKEGEVSFGLYLEAVPWKGPLGCHVALLFSQIHKVMWEKLYFLENYM